MKRFKEININRYTKFNEKSVIMKEDEFNNIIKNPIEVKINKKIKELKKLYQATVDGDAASFFHSKCDGIPNTLVIFKSAGNKRFGGFTSIQWSSPDNYSYQFDKNAFLFSLDKQKMYPFIGQEYEQQYQIIITQFIVIKIMILLLEVAIYMAEALMAILLYIYAQIVFMVVNHHIHMNQILIQVMIFIKLIMLYLKMEKKDVFILLIMKYFK